MSKIYKEQKTTEDMKKISSLWMFCADNYLAPAYSECFQNIDNLFKVLDQKPQNLQTLSTKWIEMQECQMLKQSEYFLEVRYQNTKLGILHVSILDMQRQMDF